MRLLGRERLRGGLFCASTRIRPVTINEWKRHSLARKAIIQDILHSFDIADSNLCSESINNVSSMPRRGDFKD